MKRDTEAQHEIVEAAAQKSARRQFIRHSGILTASALMGLVPPGVRQGAWAAGSDAPEKTELKVGFIPLTDCASVVIAATENPPAVRVHAPVRRPRAALELLQQVLVPRQPQPLGIYKFP